MDLNSCLDDSELQFLGAPWEEYAREASVVGLDVLRYVPLSFSFAQFPPRRKHRNDSFMLATNF